MSRSVRQHHAVGAHVSMAGGHHQALKLAREIGCEVVQVFTKNNMQWFAPPLAPELLEAYRKARARYPLQGIFGHAGYLINLAARETTNLEKSRHSLLAELERSTLLQLPFLVLHPGSHRGRGVEAGLDRVLASLDWVFQRYEGPVKIALEFTAGQGDTLGRNIEEIAWLIDHGKHADRLSVCLDTCHLFAAGYDLCSEQALQAFVAAFRKRIAWSRVACVHLNDSKGELGSRVDRHELLGRGCIGWKCFRTILVHPAFARIPLCLETPKGSDHRNDILTLRRLKRLRQKP